MKTISEILITATSLAAIAVAAAACSPENPRLMAPPVTYGNAAVEAKPVVLNVTPKVDVLFVIDNSDSMLDEQETLSANINEFTKKIATNSGIDFHIGVTSVWDTKMFAGMTKEYGHGELRRLKDPKGQNLPENFGRFVSSKEDYDSYLAKAGFSLGKKAGWELVLQSSLKIGVESYNPKHETEKTGGPENEEIFSPVKAALSNDKVSAANKGFRRTDAHLVLIFITDADAWTPSKKDGTRDDLAPGDLEEFLAKYIGPDYRERVSVLGALAKSTDSEKERDPSLRYASLGPTQPDNILSFIKAMGGKSMGLRGNTFGKELGELGTYVRERTLTKPRVDIKGATPEKGTVKVSLNGEPLELGKGWVFDNERKHSITILRDLSDVSGAIDIKVDFTQVDSRALNSGRVHGAKP